MVTQIMLHCTSLRVMRDRHAAIIFLLRSSHWKSDAIAKNVVGMARRCVCAELKSDKEVGRTQRKHTQYYITCTDHAHSNN